MPSAKGRDWRQPASYFPTLAHLIPGDNGYLAPAASEIDDTWRNIICAPPQGISVDKSLLHSKPALSDIFGVVRPTRRSQLDSTISGLANGDSLGHSRKQVEPFETRVLLNFPRGEIMLGFPRGRAPRRSSNEFMYIGRYPRRHCHGR
jgi:hypothetical protein